MPFKYLIEEASTAKPNDFEVVKTYHTVTCTVYLVQAYLHKWASANLLRPTSDAYKKTRTYSSFV